MKINKKQQVLILVIMLIVLIAIGITFFVSSGDKAEEGVESKDTPNISNVNADIKEYYNETTVGRTFVNILSVDGQLAYRKDRNKEIYSIATGELLMEIPSNISDSSFNVSIYNTPYFDTAQYDVEKKQPVYRRFDLTGKQIGGDIYLQEFEGMVYYEEFIDVKQLMSDEKYIYLTAQTKTQDYLQIFNMDGTLKATYKDVEKSQLSAGGILYLTIDKKISKINVEDEKVLYTIAHPQKSRSFIMDVAIDEKNKILYAIDEKGVSLYDAQSGAYIRDAMLFNEDASYVLESKNNICDMDVLENKEIAVIVYAPAEDASYMYKYTPVEGVRPERAVTLTITAPYRSDFMDNAIRAFELKNKDQKIEYDYMYDSDSEYSKNSEQAAQQMATRILTGDVGDIVQTGGGKLNYYDLFKTDAFTDLKTLIEQDENYKYLNKSVLDGLTLDGAIRGLPIFVFPSYYLVNVALAEELGLNLDYNNLKWSDIMALAPVLEEKKPRTKLFCTRYGKDSYLDVVDMLVVNMPELIDIDGKTVNLNQPWFLSLVKDWKETLDGGNFFTNQISQNVRDPLNGSLFTKYDVLNMSPREKYSRFSHYNEIEGNKQRIIPMPMGEKNANRVSYSNNMYSINAKSENKDLAWEFLSFLLTAEMQSTSKASADPLSTEGDRKVFDEVKRNAPKNGWASIDEYAKDRLAVREKTDYSYDMGMMKNDILQELIKYFTNQISLEDAIKQAEQAVWLRLNE